jgi:hypothetical protein
MEEQALYLKALFQGSLRYLLSRDAAEAPAPRLERRRA